MEYVLALFIGVLVGSGVWLILSPCAPSRSSSACR